MRTRRVQEEEGKRTLVIGYLIVIHEAAVNLATFVAFLIGVDRRIHLTRKHYLKHSLISR